MPTPAGIRYPDSAELVAIESVLAGATTNAASDWRCTVTVTGLPAGGVICALSMRVPAPVRATVQFPGRRNENWAQPALSVLRLRDAAGPVMVTSCPATPVPAALVTLASRLPVTS